MTTKYAFCQGYTEALLDGDKREMSNREIVERHPEYDDHGIAAYAKGRIDALMCDAWRYNDITTPHKEE